MRWVVYTLLALNVGLLSWNLHTHGVMRDPDPPAEPPPDPPEAAEQLPLLSELGGDGVRERPSAAPETAVAPVNAPAPTPAPDVAAPSGMPEADRYSAPPYLTRPSAKVCYSLGPLAASAPVQDMQSWLEAKGASVEVHRDERREVTLYWIYFPPRASRAEALEEVARIRDQGIDDVIAVPKGDMANAISLGVFSRTETRDRRLKQLSEKGHQPTIAPRYRARVATWIDVSVPEDVLAEDDIQQRWRGVEVSARPCSVTPGPSSTVAADETPRSGPLSATPTAEEASQ